MNRHPIQSRRKHRAPGRRQASWPAWLAIVLLGTIVCCPHDVHAWSEHVHLEHGHEHEHDAGTAPFSCPDDEVPHHDHGHCDFDASHDHTFLAVSGNPLPSPLFTPVRLTGEQDRSSGPHGAAADPHRRSSIPAEILASCLRTVCLLR